MHSLVIKENYGLIDPSDPDAAVEANAIYVLTEYELKKLQNGFTESMKSEEERTTTPEVKLLYGGYDPLSS